MKKVNLDKEYEKFKERNKDVYFDDDLEKAWQRYQQENDLIDKSNEVKK